MTRGGYDTAAWASVRECPLSDSRPALIKSGASASGAHKPKAAQRAFELRQTWSDALARAQGACGRSAVECSRSTGEAARARCVLRLRDRRTSVGVERASTRAGLADCGRRPRHDRCAVRNEGGHVATRCKKTSRLKPPGPSP